MVSPTNSSVSKKDYRESSYRFINLGIYLLAALANSIPAQTFSSINSYVEEQYHYEKVTVTLNVLVFPILHPILAFPANWALDRFGMKAGCTLGGAFLIGGVWMRTLLQVDNPFWCLSGSILAAIGNIFILNSASIIAANWFKPQSIPGVISMAVLANLISVTVGASIPGLILTPKSTSQDIQSFLRMEAIVISVPIVIMWIGLKSNPPTPPSKSAENRQENKEAYTQTLKKLFKNTEYIKILLAMTFSYGSITSYLAILEQSLKTIGYQQSGRATALIVLSATLSGLPATIMFARRIKTTLEYRRVISICIFFGIIAFTNMQLFFATKAENIVVLIVMGLCAGVFLLPYTALFTAYSSETVFPLSEGSATGYLFAASQTFGFVLGIGSIAIIDIKNVPVWAVYLIMGIHVAFLLASLLLTLSTKEILNRSNFERTGEMPDGEKTEQLIYSSTRS